MRVAMTGAASGIGAEVVRRLEGAEITAFDIAEPAGVAAWHRVDMGDMAAVDRAAAAVEGPFDALILNAGVPPRADNAEEVLRVNVFGLVRMAAALEDKLAPGASVVATASRAGEHWRENLAQVKALLALPAPDAAPGALAEFVAREGIDPLRAYCLSKEAVVVWTLARTAPLLERGMRVNCVSPSAVDTPILGDFIAALGARAQRSLERIGRAGEAREIAAVIAFLARPESGWLRGQNITVDGGISALTLAEALELEPAGA
jgi:NAD(P)-dependent dehydrogenase (short-subunit alcohol dehydrogenase family)